MTFPNHSSFRLLTVARRGSCGPTSESIVPHPVVGLTLHVENAEKFPQELGLETPSCFEACLFFSDDLLRLWLQSVHYDLQHDFAWMIDEANRSVVLALLQVAFLGKCDA